MKIRPCIDIHNGRVKQIIGATLSDPGDCTDRPGSVLLRKAQAAENFVSDRDADYYAGIYKEEQMPGGHIILLDPASDRDMYEADLRQAEKALKAWPGGMQLGGGVTADNAASYLKMGASHVIVTSYVFHDGELDRERLKSLQRSAGKKRLVLDLSCKKAGDGRYYVVSNRWQVFTKVRVDEDTLEALAEECDEYLVHAADVEGRKSGIDEELTAILGAFAKRTAFPVVYAGGVHSYDDLDLIAEKSAAGIDVTVGSALDIFGGDLSLKELKRRAAARTV